MRILNNFGCLCACAVSSVAAISFDVNSPDSIKAAAKTVANGVLSTYKGNQPGETPGIFDTPYYWWSAGQVWDSLIDYWFLTGDESHNDIVSQALNWQTGPNLDFMPPNQTKTEGNDDQSTWALTALTAAERNFLSLSSASNESYLSLAQAVFDEQVARWDDKSCGGGLRWQIFTFNSGYNYKNSLSNGQFLALSARLARFTGNKTYSDWAEKAYTWSGTIGLVTNQGSVYDGTDVTLNCTTANKIQWTSSAGTYLYGSAVMYNITDGDKTWQTRTNTLLSQITKVFTANNTNVLYEVACETNGQCNVDQFFFKGLLARDLARTAQIAPFTASTITPLLQDSAKAAASLACSNGEECLFSWRQDLLDSQPKDKVSNLGAQFSALQIIQQNLASSSKALVVQSGPSASNSSTTPSVSGSGTGSSTAATPNAGTKHYTGLGEVLAPIFMILMLYSYY